MYSSSIIKRFLASCLLKHAFRDKKLKQAEPKILWVLERLRVMTIESFRNTMGSPIQSISNVTYLASHTCLIYLQSKCSNMNGYGEMIIYLWHCANDRNSSESAGNLFFWKCIVSGECHYVCFTRIEGIDNQYTFKIRSSNIYISALTQCRVPDTSMATARVFWTSWCACGMICQCHE